MPLPTGRGIGTTTGTRASRFGEVLGEKKVTYRISKGTGRAMIGFAFFLDMLPILLALIMLFAAFQGPVPQENPETAWWNLYEQAKQAAEAFGAMASGAFLAAAGILILAPAAYFLSSILVPVFAFLIFLFWFWGKRVSPFSITGALLMALETVPLANLLPTITLVVWRRIRASRREDELKNATS